MENNNKTLPSGAETVRRDFDIVLAGETNLDLVLYGLPAEMPLEREHLADAFVVTLGGSSSILAHNLASLGNRVGFVSEVGDDPLGSIARNYLSDSGVDLTRFHVRTGGTTGVTILLPHGKQRHILTYPGVMALLTVQDLDLAYISRARHFHLSSLYLQTGLHAGLPGLFDRLRAAGITISLDTNDDPSDTWRGVLDDLLDRIDILLPNEQELLSIAGKPTLPEALDALALRVPLIAVKCGSRGSVVQHGSRREWVSPCSVDPVDTIGAGDSFDAGFLSVWLREQDPVRAAKFGNVTGALSTLRPGGVAAHRDKQLRQSFIDLQSHRM